MNAHSSRSHAIFTVTIECSDKGPDGKQRVRAGKLHLVDLAVSRFKQYSCIPIDMDALGVSPLCSRAVQSNSYLLTYLLHFKHYLKMELFNCTYFQPGIDTAMFLIVFEIAYL